MMVGNMGCGLGREEFGNNVNPSVITSSLWITPRSCRKSGFSKNRVASQ